MIVMYYPKFKSRRRKRLNEITFNKAEMVDLLKFFKVRKLSQNTIAAYSRYAKNLIGRAISQKTITDIILDYRANKKGDKNRDDVYLSFLKFINSCFKLKIDFDEFKATGSQGKIRQKRVSYLSHENVKAMINCVLSRPKSISNYQFILIMILMYENGLRVSEVLNLRVGDFKDNQTKIKGIGKGGVEFNEILSRNAQTLVGYIINQKQLRKEDLVFIYADVEHLRKKVWYDIKTLGEKNNILTNNDTPPTPHDFRHSFGTRLIQLKFNMRQAQVMLRHSNLETVKHYVDAGSKEELDKKKIRLWDEDEGN